MKTDLLIGCDLMVYICEPNYCYKSDKLTLEVCCDGTRNLESHSTKWMTHSVVGQSICYQHVALNSVVGEGQ